MTPDDSPRPIGTMGAIAAATAIGPLVGGPAGGFLGLFVAWIVQPPLPPETAGCGMFALGCMLTGALTGSLLAFISTAMSLRTR